MEPAEVADVDVEDEVGVPGHLPLDEGRKLAGIVGAVAGYDVVGPDPGGDIVQGDVAQVRQFLLAGGEHGGDRLFGCGVFDEFVVAADVEAVIGEPGRHDEHRSGFGEVVFFVDRLRLFSRRLLAGARQD